jgi:hypothetical protein
MEVTIDPPKRRILNSLSIGQQTNGGISMESSILRFSVLGVALAVVAGCGGSPSGGTGGSTSLTTITYSFSNPTPAAVAVKIGSGPFTAATVTGGVFSFTLPDGTNDFGVAYVCPEFSPFPGDVENLEFLRYNTALDETKYAGGCFSSASGGSGVTGSSGTLTGSVNTSAFASADWLFVSALGTNSGVGSSFNLPLNGGFSLTDAPTGTDNVVLQLYDSSLNAIAVKGAGPQAVPGALNGGNAIDFAASDATTLQPMSFLNVPTGYSTPSTTVIANSKQLNAVLQMNLGVLSGSTITQYPVLPAGIAEIGDQYDFQAQVSKPTGSVDSTVNAGATESVSAQGAGPVSISFPAPWAYAGPTPAALPMFDFSYAGFGGQSEAEYSGSLFWSSGTGINDQIEVTLSQTYQGATSSVSIPDLSAIPGFLAAPGSGTTVSWSATVVEVPSNTGTSTGGSLVGVGTSVSNVGTYIVP